MPTYFPRQSHNAGGGCWKGVGSGLCWKDSLLSKSERRTTAFAVLRDVKVVVSTIEETSFRLLAGVWKDYIVLVWAQSYDISLLLN